MTRYYLWLRNDLTRSIYYCVPREAVPVHRPSVAGIQIQTIMKKHEWREKTEEGETRLVTVTRHAGKWQLRSRLKSESEWTVFPTIELEDLETLLEIISKKYQRNRVPHAHISEIETLLAAARPRR